MRSLPNEKFKLIVTSPPYNLGKSYEGKAPLVTYLALQERVIGECVRLLDPQGSICWQVGNYVENGEIIPLDTILYPIFRTAGLQLRNRIIWHFGMDFIAHAGCQADMRLLTGGLKAMITRGIWIRFVFHPNIQTSVILRDPIKANCLATPKAKTPVMSGYSRM